ncbi:hypothetical protein CsSME_00037052 [Camellia sinensis var. sinensis]
MAVNDFNNPWGDPAPQPENGKQGLFVKKKLSKRMSEKYEKTIAVASTSMKKVKVGVKEGASASADWMKIKYHSFKNK